jgi:3-phenylpropionate/trans-cinnamate dioxygenase ferredoxin reductase subunit
MEPRHIDVLLIGGGVAAARCARTLRRRGLKGTILLVSDEPVPPYNRPPLSKELLRGEVPDELVMAEPPSWYERRGVELSLGVPVVSLAPDDHLVELADGRRIRYGRALLATGAAPRLLPVPGAMVLRTLADAHALRGAATLAGQALVVGGGFIGVEASASLAAGGVRVQLRVRGTALWGGSLGAEISVWAAAGLRAAGVDVRFAAAAPTVAPDEPLLAGIGVDPRTELAEAAGLLVDDGVVVDRRQATSAQDLFAAGDIARLGDARRVEHWHAARESGERAALGMLGEVPPAAPVPWIFSEFAGHTLDVFGETTDARPEPLAPDLHGFERDRAVVGLAVLDSAIAPDRARALIERRPGRRQLIGLLRALDT